jgi:hypothetical protein
MSAPSVHKGTKLAVPEPLTAPGGGATVVVVGFAALPATLGAKDEDGLANTKADDGSPPTVSASAAFNA